MRSVAINIWPRRGQAWLLHRCLRTPNRRTFEILARAVALAVPADLELTLTASLQLVQGQGFYMRPLLVLVQILAIRLLDAKLFQTVLQGAESEAEEFGGLGDVVVGLLHRLRDQVALDVFEVDSFGR